MPLPTRFRDQLTSLLPPERVLLDAPSRWSYSYDNSRQQALPDAVVFPHDHAEVASVSSLCNEFRIPLVPRGRGTGTTGGSVPVQHGVVMSLEQMNQILELDAVNRLMRVQPGVTNQQVQQAAASAGFFWAPDPGSAITCSVGGNLAFNAAGPRAVKYGTCRENTLGLVAVTASGETLHTGFKTTKGVTGYDLTRLLVGSEGTLATITEATLKLLPLPETHRTVSAAYRDIDSATAAVVALMNQPIIPAALEFMDDAAIGLIRNDPEVAVPEAAAALLLIDVDGQQDSIDAHVDALCKSAQNAGLLEIRPSRTPQQAASLWAARKALSPALRRIAPNKLNEDVVVPVGSIPELLRGLSALSRKHGIPIVNFGHAGNGNIHVNLLYDTANPEQSRQAKPCVEAVFRLVLDLGGALSGEHGIGTEKMAYIGQEIDAVTLAYMKRIKDLFDPNHILNPGKVFP